MIVCWGDTGLLTVGGHWFTESDFTRIRMECSLISVSIKPLHLHAILNLGSGVEMLSRSSMEWKS